MIDVRQSYLQKLLKQALAAAGHPGEAERSIALLVRDGGAVARDGAAARLPGGRRGRGKPFVEVSGRKGLGVKADDLIDTLIAKADAKWRRRNPELPEDERRRTAEMIAVAAVRYFMVRFSRGKVIAFDIDEALSFEGESGPYLQYAVVRANNIFQKLREREGLDEAAVAGAARRTRRRTSSAASQDDHGLWALVLEASRLDEVASRPCGRSSSPSWPSGRSAWRSCSTRSTTATRPQRGAGRTPSSGGRPASPTSAAS